MVSAIANDYYLMWMLFSIFIGVALAIDIGILTKTKSILSIFKRKKAIEKEDTIQTTKTPDEFKDLENLEQIEVLKKHTFRRALIWTIVWISLAAVFAVIILVTMGGEMALLFVTGYALEKSLSVDNMFVFLLIFSSLAIPYAYQHKVLMVGIVSAIVMRILLILVGVSLLETFHFMVYVFGGLLLFTGIRMIVEKKEKKIEVEKNIAVRIMKRIIPISSQLQGEKLLYRSKGVLYATPLLVALVIVEMTDLVFALDSIPAILAITTDTFIVITSNIFAILGLRSLYFLLAGMMEKFYYLKPGLAAILLFVGLKMVISEYFEVPIMVSLAVIFGILAIAMVLSFIKSKRDVKVMEKG